MLGTSTLVGSSGKGGATPHEGGGGGGESEAVVGPQSSSIMSGLGDDERTRSGGNGGGGGDLFEGGHSSGGNRWPRQETIALLKIRSDMDVTFRDSSLKGPLWEEVSRKMAELGYHRSAKKCKEKFENVYKYHKRTKDGRVGKADGKTYRFFDQLEALEQHHLSMTTSSIPSLPAQVTARAESQAPAQAAVPVTMVIPAGTNPACVTVPSSPHPISVVHTTSISNTAPHQQINVNPPTNPAVNFQSPPQPHVIQQQLPHQHHATMVGVPTHSSIQMEMASSPSATPSSSSSTSSDEELLGRRKRKRKWKDFFEKMMIDVIDKQEELQKRFLEAVEKRECDRVAREEAWKMQETARLKREHDILVQERAMAAAKDAALMSFLQKLSDQQQIPLPIPVQAPVPAQAQAQPQGQSRPVASTSATIQQPQTQVAQQPQTQSQLQQQPQPQPQPPPPPPQINVIENPLPSPTQPQLQQPPQTQTQPPTQPLPQPLPQPQPITQLPQQPSPQMQQAIVVANRNNGDNGDHQKSPNGDNLLQASSSRWPKPEVQALINLRTNLDQKYQENGPKGPLWEEISASMKKLGYNRNAKRCKEKWENINKYFKKVKESNKKRPEDSKTCPYFHQLDALYREKNKMEISTPRTNPSFSSPITNPALCMPSYGQPQLKHKGSMSAPIMAQSEQQWPPLQRMEDQESGNQDDSEEDGDEDEDDDQGSGYEIVANNSNVNAGSMINTTTTTARTATTE